VSTNTAQKLHELNTLQGLTIIKLINSALALAFGFYFLIPDIISLKGKSIFIAFSVKLTVNFLMTLRNLGFKVFGKPFIVSFVYD